ncbi:MAG TPA: class I poly(R)-hydroxyalkanoic acid synthase [Rhodocyclaceae bacterium]|nr:class I poly(R)-hydroxyalkanoic acid synthase [Rhodocyclaceae bacterium]
MADAQGPKNDDKQQSFSQFIEIGQGIARQFAQFMGQAAQQAAQPGGSAPESENPLHALQQALLQEHAQLWQTLLTKGKDQVVDGFIAPEPGDKRFSAPEWRDSPIYDYVHQAYLLNAKYLKSLTEALPAADERTRKRMRFVARQLIDAMAPSNFAATNPEFIKLALETQGQSITEGINNLIKDLEKGRISMTDEAVFEVGRNIATTEGAVVFENEVMQLIQYVPLTPRVGKRPIVVVPPSINKFYIMDLQPDNSLIRFMIEQGNTVFLVSWRNPREDLGYLGWDDYLELGVLTALKVAREISKAKELNVLGFCVGGTMLTSALAVLAARGEDFVTSLTLMTTLLDFSDSGEIGLLIDEEMIAAKEASIGKGGLLPARDLQTTFSFLRPNDLVWNYVTNNYLKGRKPAAFDLLYWNSDSTNLTGPFVCWYMRNMYHENNLRKPGKLRMCGEKIDLRKLKMPAYILAAREDHIVPWQSAYLSTGLLGGESRFVLGASGHIAGAINPASKNKRSYWVNPEQADSAETWFDGATEKPGSWWLDWADWIRQHQGGEKAAPKKLGSSQYLAIEPAPGRYVKERVV